MVHIEKNSGVNGNLYLSKGVCFSFFFLTNNKATTMKNTIKLCNNDLQKWSFEHGHLLLVNFVSLLLFLFCYFVALRRQNIDRFLLFTVCLLFFLLQYKKKFFFFFFLEPLLQSHCYRYCLAVVFNTNRRIDNATNRRMFSV